MNPKSRMHSLSIQARDAMNRGDYQLAEGLFWRLIGILRCDDQAPLKLEMEVLEGLAQACDARGKTEDAVLARYRMHTLKSEIGLYAS